ncbi:MAG TPA: hypothetical protein VEA44_16630 [Caulobacter sp.]|nr:hypothetical protein [Caulobacter sp.]
MRKTKGGAGGEHGGNRAGGQDKKPLGSSPRKRQQAAGADPMRAVAAPPG